LPTILAWIVFGALLLFGPVEPYGLIVRTAYLVLIPAATWLVSRWTVRRWRISQAFTHRLVPVLWGAFGGTLLCGAYQSATSTYHLACTQEIMTRDGKECVGDEVPVEGPDLGMAFFLVLASGFAFWVGAAKRD
jgi:hypothetical protein